MDLSAALERGLGRFVLRWFLFPLLLAAPVEAQVRGRLTLSLASYQSQMSTAYADVQLAALPLEIGIAYSGVWWSAGIFGRAEFKGYGGGAELELTPLAAESGPVVRFAAVAGRDLLYHILFANNPNEGPAAMTYSVEMGIAYRWKLSEAKGLSLGIVASAGTFHRAAYDYNSADEHPIWGLIGPRLGLDF